MNLNVRKLQSFSKKLKNLQDLEVLGLDKIFTLDSKCMMHKKKN